MPTLPHRARTLRAVVLLAFGQLAAGFAPASAEEPTTWRQAVAIESRRPALSTLPRAVFLQRPNVLSPRLSPDGRRLAYLLDRDDRVGLWLVETAGGEARRLLAETDATAAAWSRDGRFLFLISERQVGALPLDGQPGGGLVTALRGAERRRLLGVDPVHPAALLVTAEDVAAGSNPLDPGTPRRFRLLRLAPDEGPVTLHESPHLILSAAFDGDGQLAFLGLVDGGEQVVAAVTPSGGVREITRCTPVAAPGCRLIGTLPDGSAAFVHGHLEENFGHLARLDRDGTVQPWHRDPHGEADLDEVTFDLTTGMPRLASYRSIVAHVHGLDSEAARHLERITRQLPNRDLRFQIGRERWLVSERNSDRPGEWLHLYDPARGRLAPVLHELQPDSLPRQALARKLPFAYEASDGHRLHGFVFVPPGHDPARAPLITQVHGGPWNHVEVGWDAVAQFLANRGFVVFQPNFRGSTGHGRDYLEAARGDFGNGRVQQDIVDGVRQLMAAGIGDPQRVAITGGSFGGYSTLVGLTFQPEVFQVGVAFVPPPDFGWAIDWNTRETDGSVVAGVPLRDSLAALGLGAPESRERLRRESPRAHAARLRRPVVLVAAGRDDRVALRSVLHYAATLDVLGKDVTLYVEPEAGHAAADDLSREMLLYLLEATFHRHLGGPEPAPPSQELAEKLARDQRLGNEGQIAVGSTQVRP
ncbi:MAG: prolyl oligopeptidase family serine peptidase [Thermoanaerobaculia bacterium]|nr:prolyl oligopeptidase family serine peptidase [Thermoanaerobaculia bacterium]